MRRIPLRSLVAIAFAVAGGAWAQNYPAKPVRLILPFAPGGVADITARTFTQRMSETLGQQVLVDNRPSAGGIVAAQAVARSEPDGYTLFLVSNGTAVSAGLFKSLPFDPVKDFAPVSTMGYFDIVMLAADNSKIRSVKDLLAEAKANPNRISLGTIGIGSTQNLSAELFRSLAGVDVVSVPYKATPEVIAALRSGQVQVAFEILAPVLGQIRAGAVRALGIANSRRFTGLPEVPTIAESGVPGYLSYSWNGISAPAGAPRAVIERLNKETVAAAAAASVRQKLLDLGVEARASTPEELQKLLVSEIGKWSKGIERAKIEKQ
ncbi:MAG: tripartite tricarboxylate transporter substrate binding protein [Burkholderiales bacterium]|nr:tripartite tricarboxylate transporter substrate binding protein [Burkholderiales bacterium]